MVAHTCNLSTWEAETGGSQVCGQPQPLNEVLHNLVRPCFKIKNKKKPGVVAHACNPSTLGGGDRRIQVRGQPQLSLSLSFSPSLSVSLSLPSEALRNFVRPGFKIKDKKQGRGCSAEVERPWFNPRYRKKKEKKSFGLVAN